MTWQTRVFCAVLIAGGQMAQADEPPSPLVVIRLTEKWFTSRINREIDEQSLVDEVILGTRVRGSARTTGQPCVKLCNDPDNATLKIVVSGATVSRTVGRKGPAIVHSRSETHFTASKQIAFTAGEGFSAQPVQIQSTTRTTTEKIESTRGGLIGRVVRRRASRAVEENRPLTTGIARRLAQQRIAAALDRQVEQMLVQLNRSADLRETVALLRGPWDEPRYACRSTDKYVEIAIGPAGSESSPLPPALVNYDAPVQVWFHKSLVPSNVAPAVARFRFLQASMLGLIDRISRVIPVALDAPGQDADVRQTPAMNYQLVGGWTVLSWHDSRPAVSLADFGSRTLR